MNSRKNCLPVAWDSSSDPSYPQPVVVKHTGFLKDVFISRKQEVILRKDAHIPK
ncbi:hypothetical protein STEG23_015237, partial [Scotinomys teguina]